MTSKLEGIDLFDEEIDEAFPPMSVTVRLEDAIDVSRTYLPAAERTQAQPGHRRADLRDDQRAAACARSWRSSTTRMGRALVKDIQFRLDVNTLHRDKETGELGLNEIGRVQLRRTVPLLCDPYSKNRTTGSFIPIDEATGATVGAGMVNSGS
jgi:bifunctional enzyme CysN/CysC/sulfate adenylyltransferase subunit 1